jgi:hypothetical protein
MPIKKNYRSLRGERSIKMKKKLIEKKDSKVVKKISEASLKRPCVTMPAGKMLLVSFD